VKNDKNTSVFYYMVSAVIFMIGAAYVSVPLYRLFCQVTGYGGTTQVNINPQQTNLVKREEDFITVKFNTDVHSEVPWKFVPCQKEVIVSLGENTLAFFKATNMSDKPVTGVSTYNVTPFESGLFFNKVQCFCFDEQRLEAHETVDLPVLFFVDPTIREEPSLINTNIITLSYTFFKVDEDDNN